MKVVVINAPDPILLPEEIPDTASGDALVAAMISAATGEIDGPGGWLGRCLGEQTLRLTVSSWNALPKCLPFPPLIEVLAVHYLSDHGSMVSLSEDDWTSHASGFSLSDNFGCPPVACRPDAITVEYRAGYNGDSVADGGTGEVPAQAKIAVMMSVNHLRSINKSDTFLKVDFVEGVGRTEYAVSTDAGKVMTDAAIRLLYGLKVLP